MLGAEVDAIGAAPSANGLSPSCSFCLLPLPARATTCSDDGRDGRSARPEEEDLKATCILETGVRSGEGCGLGVVGGGAKRAKQRRAKMCE